jgi:ketosteroid isomerase-like protein
MGIDESSKKKAVRAYIEGFRTGDHEAILSLLTDDVTWEIPGVGAVEAARKGGGILSAVFADVFYFEGDKIRRLETYQMEKKS